MVETIIGLTWVLGSALGGLWGTSHERGDKENARLFGFSMAGCYFVDVWVELYSPYLNWWGALPYLTAMGLIFATLIIGRRRLLPSQEEEV